MQKRLYTIFILILALLFPCLSSAAGKQTVVLMPLQVSDVDKSMISSMETALVEGLSEKYKVFSGEKVRAKAKEIFNKESKAAVHKDCDESRCMQDIAVAFQAELIAVAAVTKRSDGFFIALNIKNIFDDTVVFSKSIPCKGCDEYQVIEKLKEIAGGAIQKQTETTKTVEKTDTKPTEGTDKEMSFWNAIKDSNGPAMFEAYIKQYPAGSFVELAKLKVKKPSSGTDSTVKVVAEKPRDNTAGTYTDNATRLMWQQGEGGKMNWDAAMAYCNNLSLAGYNDWRLPDIIEELMSIIDFGETPAINKTNFPYANASNYWSSSTDADVTTDAWNVSFVNGVMSHTFKADNFYVRCVRGGQ